jgi:hypothetical protein
MHRIVLAAALAICGPALAQLQLTVEDRHALLERARSLEIDTRYEPPPGDALSHHAAGYAKTMCSAVFITGLELEFAAENVGYFAAPYAERTKLGRPVVDRNARAVHVDVPSGPRRTARYVGDQGCVTLPLGESRLHFTPREIESALAPASSTPWPMGDRLPDGPPSNGIDQAFLSQSLDAAFDPAALTAAFVVTWQGRVIAERYRDGITPTTPLESWSMGKSLTATLLGILVREGVYELTDPAPIPEWQMAKDPRAAIRIADLLQMSSGLRIRAPQDPDFDPALGYPDHLYLYNGGANTFHYAATRPHQLPPSRVGRYTNTEPELVN